MLCVGDLERSLDFYGRLGFSLVDKDEDVALLALGAGQLYLFLESLPTPDKPELHLEPPRPDARPSTILVLLVGDARASTRSSARGASSSSRRPSRRAGAAGAASPATRTASSSRSRTTRERSRRPSFSNGAVAG